MKKQTLHTAIASITAIASSQGATLLSENFDALPTVTPIGRVFDNQLDVSGWQSTTGYGAVHSNPSNWETSSDGGGGRLQNTTNDTTSYVQGETPAWKWFSNVSTGANTDTLINLQFDYATEGADTLTVHFWAVQSGVTPGSNSWITNNQGWNNGNSNQNETASSGGYAPYDLNTGAVIPNSGATYFGSPLNGTGTFNATINLSTLGMSGVSDVGDIDTFFIAFAGDETGDGTGTTTTWVDNLTITSAPVPEPSSIALLGLGALACFTRRKR
ncbi:PEP-CTERM sorting domain-containing protein [Rubritalea marina]|uniref:PEP-CTERM sorting domain-containing protein n=1 Tax=Rubritalea marina TaxID=361055 RepID=UPI00036999F9|nr:PEP-CTERM sorting domain-containing protein [Rubritalea marina]